jgi:hypothetical protein
MELAHAFALWPTALALLPIGGRRSASMCCHIGNAEWVLTLMALAQLQRELCPRCRSSWS